MKSDQITKAPEFARRPMDHRGSRIESPSEGIGQASDSRSLVAARAEQIRPLLIDPAIIVEPVGSRPEAVSRADEASRPSRYRAAFNDDPDGQESKTPSRYQPHWQTNPEIEILKRFTPGGSVAASIPGSTIGISHIRIQSYGDAVSGSHRLDTSVASDEWTQANLWRYTGMQGNQADLTSAEASLRDPVRTPDLVTVSAADRYQRRPANVALLLAGLRNPNQGPGQDAGQGGGLSSPGALFPWADGGADRLFAATVSPSIAHTGVFEMTRGADNVASDLRGTTSPMPETRTGSGDPPWQSVNGQDAAEGESLGYLTSRLAAIAERLEQAALRLASQAPLRATAPRPFQGRVDA